MRIALPATFYYAFTLRIYYFSKKLCTLLSAILVKSDFLDSGVKTYLFVLYNLFTHVTQYRTSIKTLVKDSHNSGVLISYPSVCGQIRPVWTEG